MATAGDPKNDDFSKRDCWCPAISENKWCTFFENHASEEVMILTNPPSNLVRVRTITVINQFMVVETTALTLRLQKYYK